MIEYSTGSGQVLPEINPANDVEGGTPLKTVLATPTESFDRLPLSCIVASPTNPRKTFDPVKLQELAASIKASGVHQPILVRPLPGHRVANTERHVTHELIAGERRFRASKLAGAQDIPAMIRQLTDNEVLEIQIVENLQRDDLSPLEEAEGYEQLCEATGITKEQVGEKIGKSRAYVYGRLKLLDLTPACKDALRTGSIDATRALLVARIPDIALQQKALDYATEPNYAGDVPSTRALQLWLKQNVMLHLAQAPFSVADGNLCPAAGPCADCPKRTGANPDLFSDVDGSDICTDPPCYQAKEAAHRDNLVIQAESKGLRVVIGKEAKSIFKNAYSTGMEGYTLLDQRRKDLSDDGPSLRSIIGDDLSSMGAVLIENPFTKELIEAVPTKASDALLVARGLIKQTKAEASHDREIQQLKDTMEMRVSKESRAAIITQLAKDVHASPAGEVRITADLIRPWLIVQTFDTQTEDMIQALNLPQDADLDDDALRLRIQTLDDAGLWKAMAILMTVHEGTSVYDYRIRHLEGQHPAIDALAAQTLTDIEGIKKDTRDAIKAEVAERIADLQAKIKATQTPADKPAPTAAPAKSSKPAKISKEDAAKGIAQAMQGVLNVGFAVGQTVRVTAGSTLRIPLQKYTDKTGTITAKIGDRAWDVTFRGRNGGLASFDESEIEVVES